MKIDVSQTVQGAFESLFEGEAENAVYVRLRTPGGKTQVVVGLEPDGTMSLDVERNGVCVRELFLAGEAHPVRVCCNYTPDEGYTRCSNQARFHFTLRYPHLPGADKTFHVCGVHYKLFKSDAALQERIAAGKVILEAMEEAAYIVPDPAASAPDAKEEESKCPNPL